MRVSSALGANPGIGRHEGGVERAFGENGAEMIRQPQRDEKRVGHRTGAEHRRQYDVTDEAGEPREQREAADREDALDHRTIYPARAKSPNRGSLLSGKSINVASLLASQVYFGCGCKLGPP